MPEETVGPDPATLLAFLGSEVRRLRLAAGLTQAQLAKLALSTQAMISYVEGGKRIPSRELVIELDRVFETGGQFLRLLPLVIRHAYPAWFVPFVELERDASMVRVCQTHLIPGLLQTEAYARVVLGSLRPSNLDDLVAARMSRQTLFDQEDPPRAWFIMEESVLRRRLGDAEVMRAQYQHLLEAGKNPRTVIQVLPERWAGPAGITSFTIVSLEEGRQVLHVDGFPQGRLALDEREVDTAVHTYDLLRAAALPTEDSAELIGTYLKELTP